MSQANSGKSIGNKVISTKLSREEFTRFQYYCKANGETINCALRRIILAETDAPSPVRVAASHFFEYNRATENFAWTIGLDDGTTVEIDESLPASSAAQLFESLGRAIEERNSILRKTTRKSVPIPTKLTRRES